MLNDETGAGDEPAPFKFLLIPTHKPETLLEHVRSAVARGLPEVKECVAHDGLLSVAGGGPSLEDTHKDLEGYIASVNGSLSYLLSKGVTPNMCGVCDPSEHMADVIEPHGDVAYFIASCVHPKVFDKLLSAGCRVYLWHHHPVEGQDKLLSELYPEGWTQIPGGCTMGIHWVTLGYHLGFRKFHLHGLDSSFREGSTHAYPDHQDTKEWMTFDGYKTRLNFLGQIGDFIGLMEHGQEAAVDPVEIKMFGEGLLQTRYAHWLKKNPPFIWPASDVNGRRYITAEARNIPEFLKFVPRRGTCIQAGGNVGVYPRRLAREFKTVHTLEPDSANFDCLRKNVKEWKNVFTHFGALGARDCMVSTMGHESGNAGAVHVVEGGNVPMIRIDDMALTECDLIWLDIEGYEEQALKGAAGTVGRFKPAIIIEEKHNAVGAWDWLKARQYHGVTKHGNDCLYVYGGP